MGRRSGEPEAHPLLCQVLQAIAIPAGEQLRVFKDLCIPHALSARFQYLSKQALRSRNHRPSGACREALEQIQQRLNETGHDPEHRCYSAEYVRGSPRFQAAREAAARALELFGWPLAVPPRTILVREVIHRVPEVPNSLKPRPRGTIAWSGTDARLRYHRALFAMLDIEPVRSESLERVVRRREAICGRPFPASVVELLTTQGSFRLFHDNSNHDGLVTNTRGDARTVLRRLGDPGHVVQGYLQVAVENQGVVSFFARLDGSDDPPVFHDNDQADADLSEVEWCPCAGSFSAFVFLMMTQWRFRAAGCAYRLSGRGPAPDARAAASLGERFGAGPVSAMPDEVVRSFFTPHGVIRITEAPSGRVPPPDVDWTMDADSPAALLDLAHGIGQTGSLPRRMKLDAEPAEHAPRIKAGLSRIRAGLDG
jgi:hypothetical protein